MAVTFALGLFIHLLTHLFIHIQKLRQMGETAGRWTGTAMEVCLWREEEVYAVKVLHGNPKLQGLPTTNISCFYIYRSLLVSRSVVHPCISLSGTQKGQWLPGASSPCARGRSTRSQPSHTSTPMADVCITFVPFHWSTSHQEKNILPTLEATWLCSSIPGRGWRGRSKKSIYYSIWLCLWKLGKASWRGGDFHFEGWVVVKINKQASNV